MKDEINPTDLEVVDWVEMEEMAIRQIKEGQKIIIAASEIMNKATKMIKALGGEPTKERVNRISREGSEKSINST